MWEAEHIEANDDIGMGGVHEVDSGTFMSESYHQIPYN